jgi:hypothetical protein
VVHGERDVVIVSDVVQVRGDCVIGGEGLLDVDMKKPRFVLDCDRMIPDGLNLPQGVRDGWCNILSASSGLNPKATASRAIIASRKMPSFSLPTLT